jgi:hypothetical protein
MSIVKRQRELKKAEKAAEKRAKRHNMPQTVFSEPQPTMRLTDAGIQSGTAVEPDVEADEPEDEDKDEADTEN